MNHSRTTILATLIATLTLALSLASPTAVMAQQTDLILMGIDLGQEFRYKYGANLNTSGATTFPSGY